MGIVSNLRTILRYYKTFKTNTIVRLGDKDACDLYASICVYRAQESVGKYYTSFNPAVSQEEAMELIFCSKDLRETIKEVLQDTIMYIRAFATGFVFAAIGLVVAIVGFRFSKEEVEAVS